MSYFKTHSKRTQNKKADSPAKRLFKLLEYKRPHASKGAEAFCARFLDSFCTIDAKGNRIHKIGKNPKICFSSHFDTVHSKDGFQKIALSGDKIKLAHTEKESNCLGADCSTGIWLMLELIKAKKDGLYIFHAGEECGGIGSAYIAKYMPELLKGIEACIAFDRKGKNSIITYQGGLRCCSDSFADSLAAALPSLSLAKDTGGSFTDSANYTRLIPECTNLSVGYENAHSASETQSLSFALHLREALLACDFSKLKIERKPEEQDSLWDSGFGGSYYGGFGYGGFEEDSEWRNLEEYIFNNSERVADFLQAYGVTIDEIESHAMPKKQQYLLKGA